MSGYILLFEKRAFLAALRLMLAIFSFLPLPLSAFGQKVNFPTSRSIFSPNHHFLIVEKLADNNQHIIYLKNLKSKTTRVIATYDRHGQAIWSPDSRRIAWTDYAGSDYSECSVINVDSKVTNIPILNLVEAKVSPEERKMIASNDHIYVTALDWISNSVLKVKVWGYGNGKEFSRVYTVNIAPN